MWLFGKERLGVGDRLRNLLILGIGQNMVSTMANLHGKIQNLGFEL